MDASYRDISATSDIQTTSSTWTDVEMRTLPGDLEALSNNHLHHLSYEQHARSLNKPCHDSVRVTYLDGLRGVAAICVYVYHFSYPFYGNTMGRGYRGWHDSSFLQLPIVRLIYSGPAMVGVFFVISGYALSLRPLLHAQQRNTSAIQKDLASSAFRRGIRLFGPPLISTFIYMILAQFRLIGPDNFPSGFVPERPLIKDSFVAQFFDWSDYTFQELANPWTWEIKQYNPTVHNYGGQLWTVSVEFRASIVLYLILFVLSLARKWHFLVIAALLDLQCWILGRWDVAMFITGMLVAKADVLINAQEPVPSETRQPKFLPTRTRWKRFRVFVWGSLFLCGLWVLSIPDVDAFDAPGYELLLSLLTYNLRIWHCAGAVLIVISVSRTGFLRSLFSSPSLRYLGKISYALYIVHEPFLQIMGWEYVLAVRHMFGASTHKHLRGYIDGLAFVSASFLLAALASIFCTYVDEPCIRLSKWAERKCFAQCKDAEQISL